MTSDQHGRIVAGHETLVALAVPARFAILDHLLSAGPATASQCADVVRESPSNCSWHLRVLAEKGLVERVHPEGADGRSRWWQAAAVGFAFGGEAGGVARAAVEAVQTDHADALYRRHLAQRASLPEPWAAVSGGNEYTLSVSPDELAQLTEEIDRILRPYLRPTRETAPADARTVRVGLRAFPEPA